MTKLTLSKSNEASHLIVGFIYELVGPGSLQVFESNDNLYLYIEASRSELVAISQLFIVNQCDQETIDNDELTAIVA